MPSNLAALMARIAYGRKIAVEDVRRAAREWYTQDKLSITKSNTRLSAVLNFIISQVIEQRRTRAFLFQSGLSQPEIEQLLRCEASSYTEKERRRKR